MDKLDLKKARKTLFSAPVGAFFEVDVPTVKYLMTDGSGGPDDPTYDRAVQGLYATAYSLKFACKADGRDFVVAPLEGLWWADDPGSFVAGRRSEWNWTMMIMLPDFVADPAFDAAKAKARMAAPETILPRLAELTEGPCLQTLHIGAYADEGPILAKLHHEVMPARGFAFAGPHHEVYLNDPRRTETSKLKTILRQPVRPVA
ncbi:MAG TPA: GyrI-like domain-containing protein [Croceibacterium sp.]